VYKKFKIKNKNKKTKMQNSFSNFTSAAFVSMIKEFRKMFYTFEGVWVHMKIWSN